MTTIDTQVIELLGRQRLVSELLRAGLEVALPMRDRGVDLIVYADLKKSVDRFVARPIQMKAASNSSFGIWQKFEKIQGLILAYVWHVGELSQTVTHALTYEEAFKVAEAMNWTTTPSWIEKGGYGTTNPNEKLLNLLGPHRMTPELWWSKITGLPEVHRDDKKIGDSNILEDNRVRPWSGYQEVPRSPDPR